MGEGIAAASSIAAKHAPWHFQEATATGSAAPAPGKAAQIVGGGLAGLALGIGLRLADVPVTIWEAGRYPRHRVCGEVLSGRGQDFLRRLGLLAPLLERGARLASTAAFFSGARRSALQHLDCPALCISRYELDHFLAQRFQVLGGALRENQRWQQPEFPEGVVRASGRPPQPIERGWRWFGLKAHFSNISLKADIEMHMVPSGYVGLCQLRDGTVNVCGLFRRCKGSEHPPRSWRETLRGAPGSVLHERLARAQCDEASFCSVAGLPLQPRRGRGTQECRLGDALTMIAPITGNGMSMALEAAELALPHLTAYSQSTVAWAETCTQISHACDARFASRLRWAAALQTLLLNPTAQAVFLLIAQRQWPWRALFHLTR